jgi:hypothetical protein
MKDTATIIHLQQKDNVIINRSFRLNDKPEDILPDSEVPVPSVNNSIDALNGIYNVAPKGDESNPIYFNPITHAPNTIGLVSNYLQADFCNFAQMLIGNYTQMIITPNLLEATLNKSLFSLYISLEYDPVHQIFNNFDIKLKLVLSLIQKNDCDVSVEMKLANVTQGLGKTNGPQLLNAFTTDTAGMPQEYIDGTKKITDFTSGIMTSQNVGFPHFFSDGRLITGNFLSLVPTANEKNASDAGGDFESPYWINNIDANIPILGHIGKIWNSFGTGGIYPLIQMASDVGPIS